MNQTIPTAEPVTVALMGSGGAGAITAGSLLLEVAGKPAQPGWSEADEAGIQVRLVGVCDGVLKLLFGYK